MALQPPRNVHVLLIHGVGWHSRLSSLLQAYQGIRSNLRSHEAPITFEDPIPNWRLEAFGDEESPPYTRLVPRYLGVQPGPTESVYLYEVNYSALAGVIRKNQPLDITHLFVSFDLAVNVARARLANEPLAPSAGATFNHAALALQAQKLAGVCAAATVPILGIPSWILRNYTETFVTTFTRFFEDIATFALDKNGEELISAHLDKTMHDIVSGPRFSPPNNTHKNDEFVIVAHSLGSVVAHNYLVRHWKSGGRPVPRTLLTFGSPIGLVCWLWLFLDFPRMVFDANRPAGDNYFCWTPEPPPSTLLQQIQWINVLNYLDPLATAFPAEYVNLGADPKQVAAALIGGQVAHRYVRTGNEFSAGFSHTDYFNSKTGFVEILLRTALLRPDDPLSPAACFRNEHWQETKQGLVLVEIGAWAVGLCFLGAFLQAVVDCYGSKEVLTLFILFGWPSLTIAYLSFFQRLIFGGPTKRTPTAEIKALSWRDFAAFPYRFRRALRLGRKNPNPLASGPGWLAKLILGILSFGPTAAAMILPMYVGQALSTDKTSPIDVIVDHPLSAMALIVTFGGYLLCFTVSRFAAHWRAVVNLLTHQR